MFYSLRHYCQVVDPSSLKFGKERLKALLMTCEFSFKDVSVAAWRISMCCHEHTSCYKSHKNWPISIKLQKFHKTLTLNTSM